MSDHPQSELDELNTPKQISAYIGKTEAALAQDRYLGQGITYIKVGKLVRYRRADVLAYLEANRVETSTSA